MSTSARSLSLFSSLLWGVTCVLGSGCWGSGTRMTALALGTARSHSVQDSFDVRLAYNLKAGATGRQKWQTGTGAGVHALCAHRARTTRERSFRLPRHWHTTNAGPCARMSWRWLWWWWRRGRLVASLIASLICALACGAPAWVERKKQRQMSHAVAYVHSIRASTTFWAGSSDQLEPGRWSTAARNVPPLPATSPPFATAHRQRYTYTARVCANTGLWRPCRGGHCATAIYHPLVASSLSHGNQYAPVLWLLSST